MTKPSIQSHLIAKIFFRAMDVDNLAFFLVKWVIIVNVNSKLSTFISNIKTAYPVSVMNMLRSKNVV